VFVVSYKSDTGSTASGLGLLIFLAILLHKAPAAIGFGTFLHHEGLRDWGLAKHLLVLFVFINHCKILGFYSDLPTDCHYKLFWIIELGTGHRSESTYVLGWYPTSSISRFFLIRGYYSHSTRGFL
jgi:hypothetical protein